MNYIYLVRAKRRGSERFEILRLGTIHDREEAMQRAKTLPAEWSEAWVITQSSTGDGRIVNEERAR